MSPVSRRRPVRRFRRTGMPAATVALLAALACSGDDGGPTPPGQLAPDPGPMQVVVSSAPSTTGVLLLEITGEVDGTATATGDAEAWQHAASASRTVVLVRAPTVPGPVLRIQSPDRGASYTVRVLDAAASAAGGYAVLEAGDFSVSIDAVD